MTSFDRHQQIIETEDRIENLLDVREWIDARLMLLQSRLDEVRGSSKSSRPAPNHDSIEEQPCSLTC